MKSPGAAQQPGTPQQPAAPDQRGKIVSNVQLVVVPVTVKDSRGELVGDLQGGDFRLLEDGVEQHISLFSADAAPLSTVILIDEGMKQRTAQELQKSLVAMSGGFSNSDEVALSRFDAFYSPILDFTTDHDQLVTELKRVDLSASAAGIGSALGATGSPINTQQLPGSAAGAPQPVRVTVRKRIDDAVYEAAEALRDRDPTHRKLILLVSNGINAKNNTHSYDQTLKLLLASNISVYSVGVEAPIGVPLVSRRFSALSSYARATGGDIYYASDEAELSRFYAQVGEQARHQYTLGYYSYGTDTRKDYHSVEVRVRRPDVTVMCRDGYYPVARP